MDSNRISPTAHYTGYTWFRHGLSHPALSTGMGRAMHLGMAPANALARRLGQPTLPGLLLARHACIDHFLDAAIRSGEVGQVIELAAGLSPRGWRFKLKHPNLVYTETDLEHMAKHKHRLLESAGIRAEGHDIRYVDILKPSGSGSLPALFSELDPRKGVAVISEGLLNYFPRAIIESLWARCCEAMRPFPHGLYLGDLHLATENSSAAIRSFVRLLGVAVRGRVHLHYGRPELARTALANAGFADADLVQPSGFSDIAQKLDPNGARVVRIIRATTG